MRTTSRQCCPMAACLAVLLLTAGCDSTDAPADRHALPSSTADGAAGKASVVRSRDPSTAQPSPSSETPRAAATSENVADENVAEEADNSDFRPLQLGIHTGAGFDTRKAARPQQSESDQQADVIIRKLKPLQVLLGKWRGTTRREFEGFKAMDSHEWIWDLQTDPSRPALTLNSDRSPYLRQARLTWDSNRDVFVLEVTDGENVTRQLTGDFTEPVHEIVGTDDKLHRVFRLELNEVESSQEAEAWQIAFAQQENDRYLLEVGRRRGTAPFRRYDTVSTQREGTSFAISDAGYGDKTCIISQGLGTISVSYQGRSYWVCCSGCKAAFDADPEKWIARAEKQKTANR
ncbi:MAG: hypothetical protein R3C19_00015 [Planctomycetaceae bacterium]